MSEHEHDWIPWARPAVYRDSLGAIVPYRLHGQEVTLVRLSGTDEPATPGWWRTCRTCPAEELWS